MKGFGERRGEALTFVMLGISDENIRKLKQDQPLVVYKEELQIDTDIFIFWGTDEAAMLNKLREQGFPVDQIQVVTLQ